MEASECGWFELRCRIFHVERCAYWENGALGQEFRARMEEGRDFSGRIATGMGIFRLILASLEQFLKFAAYEYPSRYDGYRA